MNKSQKKSLILTIGALGIVFGDIGTSPLYVLNTAFTKTGFNINISKNNLLGVISLIIWSLIIVVSIQFVFFLMKADNDGEGGILSLVALIRNNLKKIKHQQTFIILGIIGVALFFGDSTITPAISVLSAVEGLKLISPSFTNYIIPITLAIVVGLFMIQKKGSGLIGEFFGPIMLIWFSTIAIGGGLQVIKHPYVLAAILPTEAIGFFINNPGLAFVSIGAVVLAVTGSEALYADLGHFGRQPIKRAWFYLVFPSLILCYMGEAALILSDHLTASSPLFLLFPKELQIPVIIIATLATVIASQSVISGAFSLAKQAIALNFLPKLKINHTSRIKIGQIYLPFVNICLFLAVSFLVIYFKSSVKLANAFGFAVSGTLLVDAILYLVLIKNIYRKSLIKIAMIGVIILPLDILFVTANLSKIREGGWFPLLIGLIIFEIIITWIKGRSIISKERRLLEKPLIKFIDQIHDYQPAITRIPGVGVYIGHHADLTPLALHANFNEFHELHDQVIILTIETTDKPHIPENMRATIDNLKYPNDGISHIKLSFGFYDHINIPDTLNKIKHLNKETNFTINNPSYFVSLSEIVPSKKHNLVFWRKYLYIFMAKNSLSNSEFYLLPLSKTVEIRYLITL